MTPSSYHDHLFQRVKQQEDVRDRWVRYYLVIMAAALTIVGLGIREHTDAATELQKLFPVLGVFFFLIGLLFFSMFLSQRYNIRAFVTRMAIIEDLGLLHLLPGDQDAIRSPLKKNPNLGADMSVQLLYILVNSTVLGLSAYALAESPCLSNIPFALIPGLPFAVSMLLHAWYLRRIKKVIDGPARRYC